MMKKAGPFFAAILFLAVQAGCSHAPAGGTASFSRAAGASSAVSQIGLKPGESVRVNGQDGNFELHGVDFLDDSAGWMIQDRYHESLDSDSSQLLATSDGGGSWSKVGSDSRQIDEIRFVSREEGWAVSQETTRPAAADVSKLVRYSILRTGDGGKTWSVQWKGASGESESAPALWAADGKNGFALISGTLLKTADGGGTWSAVSFGVRDFSPVRMFFTDSKTGWVAGVSGGNGSLAVLRTSDGGKSWSRQFRKTMDEGAAGCAAMDFLNAEEGWFLTSDLATWNGELYHTVDGGVHWNKTGEVKSVRPTPEGLCFLDSRTGWIPLNVGAGPIAGGLSVTHDGGKTFSLLGDTGEEDSEIARKVTSAREITFRTKQLGWAVGMDLNLGDYLLKTCDGGNHWQQMYPNPVPTTGFSFVDRQIGYGLGELSDPNALLKTEDGGKSWSEVKSFTGEYQTDSVSFLNSEEGWVLAEPVSSGGSVAVLHTADGGKTWSRANLGFVPRSVSYFRFLDRKNGLLLGDSSIYRTADGGKTWNFVVSKDSVVSRQMELNRLSGDATQWREPAVGKDTSEWAAALLPGGKGMILAERGGQNGQMELLTTSDAGKTWAPHPLPQGLGEEAFDSVQSRSLMQFADGAHGWILAAHGMLATSDGGRTWAWL